MAYDDEHKSAAQLEREAEQQRQRVASTVDTLRDRLSPGQLLDEVLSYSKSGGTDFVANFGKTVSANPVPATLLGVSLAWLMAKPNGNNHAERNVHYWSDGYDGYDDYPTASISGSSLRRISHIKDDAGRYYSEFTDDAGKRYRAMSDELGNRAGHFMDDTGNTFKGFTNQAGERVQQFMDEAGNMLSGTSEWASHGWGNANRRMHDARDAMGRGAGHLGHALSSAGGNMQHRAGDLGHSVNNIFNQQPLVGGALAFALGAVLASALPRTEQEDKVLGDAADKVKGEAEHMASDLYDQGKKAAEDLYEDVSDKAADVYGDARNRLGSTPSQPGSDNISRH